MVALVITSITKRINSIEEVIHYTEHCGSRAPPAGIKRWDHLRGARAALFSREDGTGWDVT